MLIYVDHAATTPLRPCAQEAMLHAIRHWWGNPSSLHRAGREAHEALESARARLASLLGAHPREVVFTSGGTESDNTAIRMAAALGALAGKRHILTTAIEHHAVRHTVEALAEEGFDIEYLPVSADGYVSVDRVAEAIRPDTALVSVMYASNEIGTIQPMAALGALCRARSVLFHTDAVQAVGHTSVDVQRDGVDFLALSAHKFGGPRGVGALYIRAGLPVMPRMRGGAQEAGRRAGTENLPAIVGMVAALEEAVASMDETAARLESWRNALAEGLRATVPQITVNGAPPRSAAPHLPGLLSLSIEGIDGEALVYRLDAEGMAASAGSACAAGSPDPSPVLLALGQTPQQAFGGLRLSLGEGNTDEDIARLLAAIPPLVADLRRPLVHM